jgi:hypothetical protein
VPTDLNRIQPTYQLQPLDLVSPGFHGVNTVQSGSLLDPSYCVQATNAVIDTSGRLAARNGVTTQTTTPITGNHPILYSFEFVQGNNQFQQLVTWAGGISNNISNPSANNIAGSVNVSNGQWFMGNFNNKVIGFQSGQKPIVWNGTGNFATIVESQGTAPTGGVGCTAFGRVWCLASDGQTIRYSGLLDETDWGSASSGTIDMHTIWSAGTDTVTAIVAFNASLVVFGNEHIVFFTDGRGSMLGIDPTQAYVFDVIASTGTYSQWTVQQIGEGDMIFLGPNGLQSLQNLQNARSFPMVNLSKYIRDDLLAQVAGETTATVRSSYNNFFGQYLLFLPNSATVWCADVRRIYQDVVGDPCAIMTNWNMTATASHATHGNLTFIARTPGTIGIYSGNNDEGSQYQFNYLSGWLNLGDQVAQRTKLLKRFEGIIFSGGTNAITFSWNTDFGNNTNTATLSIAASGVVSQYGLGQYGLSQYGGGSSLSILKYDARARGQYYQVGISATVSSLFSIQQIQLAVKIGRIA